MKSQSIVILLLFTFSSLKLPEQDTTIGSSVADFLISHKEAPLLDNISFITWAFSNIGIIIPRTLPNILKIGKEIGFNELLPGDLLFFKINSQEIDHVAIYTGNNMISHVQKAGEPIIEESLNLNIFKQSLVLAKRITNNEAVNYILERMEIKKIHQSRFITYIIESGYKNDDY